jgi:hypothetical protein
MHVCRLGYSDFHNLMRFTSKKMLNNILKNVVKKVFQLVKPFLANLHSTSSNKYSYMYSKTPNFFSSFSTYEYSKYAEFYADFKSVEIIGKKSTHKKFFAKYFCKLEVWKRRNSDFSHFFWL